MSESQKPSKQLKSQQYSNKELSELKDQVDKLNQTVDRPQSNEEQYIARRKLYNERVAARKEKQAKIDKLTADLENNE